MKTIECIPELLESGDMLRSKYQRRIYTLVRMRGDRFFELLSHRTGAVFPIARHILSEDYELVVGE